MNDDRKVEPHTVLSLDLGSTTGWAMAKNNIIYHSGSKGLYIKDAHPGLRFMKFHNWLVKFRNVDEIFVEDVVQRFMSMHAARVYCGLLAVLQLFCLSNDIKLTGIKPSAVKKEFTGAGNAKKEAVCNEAIKLGWGNGKLNTAKNHDEADAIAIYYAVMNKRGQDVFIAGKEHSDEKEDYNN